MAEIVILGAGLTGLSVAYHLEKLGFYNYKIFEKEATIGGLCRSITQDGFTFDYTGHLLHINNPYFRDLISQLIGLDQFNAIARRSFIYSQDCYTHYPYQINLHGLPPDTIIECIEGFLTRPQARTKPRSFYQWVMRSFGAGISKHFFLPYQRKIFDYDTKRLTASWTGRFVPPTSLQDMLKGALGYNNNEEIGYNARFIYPKHGGIITWVEQIYKQLKNPVYTNFHATEINLRDKVIRFDRDITERFTYLVNTIPLDIFLGCLREQTSSHLSIARNSLLCNSVVNFNIGLKREELSSKHWVYYPEARYPFYRIGFPHNFSLALVPPGHSSLYGEFSHLKKSSALIHKRLRDSLHSVKKLFNITDQEIATQLVITIPHAYVIYNQWRDKNIPIILKKLESSRVHSIGRYGAWKYSSMQDSVLDGKTCAEKLISRL
jgi:protoporphyrinogen oxidase